MRDKIKRLLDSRTNEKSFEMILEICKLADPEMADLMLKRKDDFDEMVLNIHLEHYTEEEIDFLLERVESPIGRQITEREPALMDKTMSQTEKFLEKITSEYSLSKLMGGGFAGPDSDVVH